MGTHCKILIADKSLTVRILETSEERARGYQDSIDPPNNTSGLLFVFDSEKEHKFHMRNVMFDLDLIGFDAGGRLVCAFPMQSNSTQIYPTPPCKFIVETQRGFSRDLPEGCKLQILEQ